MISDERLADIADNCDNPLASHQEAIALAREVRQARAILQHGEVCPDCEDNRVTFHPTHPSGRHARCEPVPEEAVR